MEWPEIILSSVSLVVSIVALIKADRAAQTANRTSARELDLSHGTLELEMRRALNESNERISELSLAMRPYITKLKKNEISDDERAQLAAHEESFNAAIQNWLNVYEDLCGKYVDGKVDKIRFKKAFVVEIRNLLERDNLRKYFDPVSTRYRAIVKVYREWEDHER